MGAEEKHHFSEKRKQTSVLLSASFPLQFFPSLPQHGMITCGIALTIHMFFDMALHLGLCHSLCARASESVGTACDTEIYLRPAHRMSSHDDARAPPTSVRMSGLNVWARCCTNPIFELISLAVHLWDTGPRKDASA